MCQIFTLLLIYSHCFIINPVIDAHMLLPLLIFANSHYIWPPHTLSPLNYYGSHGSKLCPPQLLWVPWLHTLSPSIIMDPMAPHDVPLNYYGSRGSTLCPTQWLWIPWLHTLSHSMIMAPMTPQYVPLIDYGSHGSTLCTTHLLCIPWLPTICPPSITIAPSWWIVSLLHPWPTPQLGDCFCSLFNDILTPPIFNLRRNRLLLEVGQITYISTHMDKGII